MPKIFKALATIAAWTLFVTGCLGILLPLMSRLLTVVVTGNILGLFASFVALNVGVIALALSVGVMKLRQMLE